MSIIQVKNVSKTYIVTSGIIKRKRKEIKALTDISFEINEGEIFCPIGPNGAGKTTLIKILSTLAIPNEGYVLVDGHNTVKNPKEIRKKIGVLFGGDRGLYWRISARDNLDYFGNLYEIEPRILKKRIDELLEILNLKSRQDENIENFSRGMKQKIHIARCLLHDPKILFLDEPTLELDVEAANDLRNLIRSLKAQGKTIILTSHYMDGIEKLADRIGLIFKGELKAIDTVEKIKKRFNNPNLEEAYLAIIKQGREEGL